jgi:hypothetical protein
LTEISKEHADEFVEEQWVPIAVAAWRNYQRHGRGALLVNWAWVERWVAGQAFRFNPPFVTEIGVPEFRALIDSYDPKTSVLVVFTADLQATDGDNTPTADLASPANLQRLRAGSGLGAWIYTFRPPPPEAHARASH